MKFTKEDAYKELVKQMTAKGEALNLSSRSINEQLEKLMPLLANDETELSDFVNTTLPIFKTADANVRNDVSEGIKKYKDENPIQTQTSKTKEGNTELDEMRKRLEKMESEYKSRQEAERIANTRNEIVEKLKAKGVKDTTWLTPFLSDITITEDFDVDAKVETYLKSYNTFKAQIDTDVTPKGAGGSNLKDDDTIKRAAEIAKQNRLVGENE
jgi:hypothetical protein